MIVIVVGQSKGGVGKTTLAVNVAGAIAGSRRAVTLIDADPQRSALEWAEPLKLEFPVREERFDAQNPKRWMRDVLKTRGDVVVVDLPAGFGELFDTAVFIADLLVVPCGPSSLDINATHKTVLKARDLRRDEVAHPLKIVTVPTRVDPTSDEGEQIGDALSEIGEPVAPPLSFDPSFVRSFTEGSTVAHIADGGQAAQETAALAAFLLRHVMPRRESAFARTPRRPGPTS